MSTVVVSIWLVPSMSSTSATIWSGPASATAASTRASTASFTDAELTQNSGTSTRMTSTSSTV